ncbi:MAG: hypothetical protein LBF60_06045 [Treponema sp.]|nr:hypothetical protein [Treponema sp.]
MGNKVDIRFQKCYLTSLFQNADYILVGFGTGSNNMLFLCKKADRKRHSFEGIARMPAAIFFNMAFVDASCPFIAGSGRRRHGPGGGVHAGFAY